MSRLGSIAYRENRGWKPLLQELSRLGSIAYRGGGIPKYVNVEFLGEFR